MRTVKVKLKNGIVVSGDEFDDNDFLKLKDIFKKWQNMNSDLNALKGRSLNVPDVFSEALFCLAFNAVRTNAEPGAHSYDCVIKDTGEGVQVKSASIPNDCTSFGPTSTWDLLYYADFAPNGYVDGNVWFYKIDSEDVYGLVLNQAKNETFADQQAQGRRPRFSIKSRIINAKGLQPVKKVSLL
ncbi:Bsp6I family type II restriction endonuclease [Candidatus Nanosyncoccus alces]|uniref:Bsp6I family restriction endonuclease n=1 Tax=Candidatus Nanosyncoccus alces TaxID=2171997 RepID=A0ABY0FM77_9BACT|nr:Bsp6I family type II restriction endonuclease [Candidatus Nanosyncoccus alces]RYC74379.1 hypothetical protein G3RUM_00530 [Candidatus Nanosyncoccus alces]